MFSAAEPPFGLPLNQALFGLAVRSGDKLARRGWREILAGGYVTQAFVAPGGWVVSNIAPAQVLQVDLRDYVYDGQVQWLAARLYEGPAEGPTKACMPTPHESRLFLLNDNEPQLQTHDGYVALVRGEGAAAEFADHHFILVEWCLVLACGQPEAGVIDTEAAPAEAQCAQTRAVMMTLPTQFFKGASPCTNEF